MAMNYNDLIGSKSVPGSIFNFVNYKKVPVEVVLEEAQALIFQRLRIREMRASTLITLALEAFTTGLPTGFLEPIAMVDRDGWEVIPHRYVQEAGLIGRRVMDTDVVTTLTGSIAVGASTIAVAAYTNFPTSDPFTIKVNSEVMLVTAGHGTLSWTVTRAYGGTTAAAHVSGDTVDGMLESGTPMHVAIFDELFQFDCKADEVRRLDLVFYKKPTLLSSTNTSNFLCNRYPNMLRVACQAGAANFMKDADEFKLRRAELDGLCEDANAESDLGRAS